MPEEDDLVVCTVKKILFHSIFVTLDEYNSLEGMIHISEIAPGRIRNIRDYVREGKQLICKVLKVYPDKKQFDLSLRRVSAAASKAKNQEFKQEQKAEKMLEVVAHNLKKDLKNVYENAGYKILEKYSLLMPCLQDVAQRGDIVFKEIKIAPDYAKAILEVIKERIKPLEITTNITLSLKSNASNGIDVIKKALGEGEKLAEKEKYRFEILYLGAPKYRISVTSSSPKESRENAEKIAHIIVETLDKDGGEGELQK